MSLPSFGWSEHSEQVDAASLEARVWSMNTRMLSGFRIVTALLQEPDANIIAKLEAMAQHKLKCTSTKCAVGTFLDVLKMCPGGKYNPSVRVFTTLGFDAMGLPIPELGEVSYSSEAAMKNHHAAVLMTASATGAWHPIQESRA